jgi:ribosomal protein L12E/L44/L45/RPP1/RPP2
MDNRNRRNDNGTAAVLVALFAGVSALGILGGAVFFLADSESKESASLAEQTAEQTESSCNEGDIACLAEEAGVSEQVYLSQICQALGGTDCGQTTANSSNQSDKTTPAGETSGPEADDAEESPDDEAEEEESEDDEEDEPEADPEEEPEEPADDDDILELDPELLYCFFDADSDGLFNCEEETHGTDPNNWDTDGDGLGDGVEVGSGLGDPTLADTDNDALSDYQEMMYGTNPWSTDTDGDGSSDSGEIFWGTDPLDPDDEPFEWWF